MYQNPVCQTESGKIYSIMNISLSDYFVFDWFVFYQCFRIWQANICFNPTHLA